MQKKELLPLKQFLGAPFSLTDSSVEYALEDDSAQFLKEVLKDVEWDEPLMNCDPYSIRPHRGWEAGQDVGLFHNGELVGFYEGPNLWIEPAHRGKGLATPLIVAAAWLRGGRVLPEGIAEQGYSPAGMLAHVTAHLKAAVHAAHNGEVVPAEVLAEYNLRSQEELLRLFPDEEKLCPSVSS